MSKTHKFLPTQIWMPLLLLTLIFSVGCSKPKNKYQYSGDYLIEGVKTFHLQDIYDWTKYQLQFDIQPSGRDVMTIVDRYTAIHQEIVKEISGEKLVGDIDSIYFNRLEYYSKKQKMIEKFRGKFSHIRRNPYTTNYEWYSEMQRTCKKGRNVENLYPSSMNTKARRNLYDNLLNNEGLVLDIDSAILETKKVDWKTNRFKKQGVENAIKAQLEGCEIDPVIILRIAEGQPEYD